MNTSSRNFFVRALSLFLVLSLVYAPFTAAPLSTSVAYAQGGDGGDTGGSSSGGGGGSSSGGGSSAATDNAGIDSQGNLDSGAFGINNDGQVVDSEGNVVDLSSGWTSFGSFLATIFDILIAISPIGVFVTVANTVVNVVNGTTTTMGEKVAAAVGFSSATSAVGAISRDVMSTLGIDLGKTASDIVGALSSAQVSEVQINTDGTVEVDGRVSGNTLDNEGLADWGSYVERENNGYAEQGQSQAVSLGASGSEVARGGEVTLTWSSEPRSSCLTQGYGWTGVEDSSGSAVIRNIQEDQVFLIQCTYVFEVTGGSDNAQSTFEKRVGLAHAEVRVRNSDVTASTTPGRPQTAQPQPVPTQSAGDTGSSARGLSLHASRASSLGQATLFWSASGNSQCSFAGPWPGSSAERAAAQGRDASAVSQVFNITRPTEFRITCVGIDGVSRSVGATVSI